MFAQRQIHNLHDFFARHFFENIPEVVVFYVRRLLPNGWCEHIMWSETRVETVIITDITVNGEKRPDVVIILHLTTDDGCTQSLCLNVDFKYRIDPDTALQLLGYEVRLMETRRMPVLSGVIHTGNDKPHIPSIEKLLSRSSTSILAPLYSYRHLSYHLQQEADETMLADPFGVFACVQKNISKFEEPLLIKLLQGMHRLLRMGRVNEVVALTDYMIRAEGNGVDTKHLVALEAGYFRDIAMEERVMVRYALSSEIAKDEGLAEGLARGKAEGKAEGLEKGRAEGISEGQRQLVLRLLQSNVDLDEEVIRKAAQLSKRELALLKKKANGTKA